MNLKILRFDTIESTNSVAVTHARQDADEGLCIVAGEQTEGRGRRGRTWISKKGSGLYFSALLRPSTDPGFNQLLTFVAAVAIADSLKDLYGLEPDIKWPNDVLVGEKKISGVLAETVESNRGIAIILGIGINLARGNSVGVLEATTTSIEAETGSIPSAEELLNSIIRFLFYFYEEFRGPGGPAKIISEWSARSTYASGRKVRIDLSGGIIEGETAGLEADGQLRVSQRTGEIALIQAGDVTSLRT